MKNTKINIGLYNRVKKVIDYYNKNNLSQISVEEISSYIGSDIPYNDYLDYIFNLENRKIACFLDYLLKISDKKAKNEIINGINLDDNFYYIEEKDWNIPEFRKVTLIMTKAIHSSSIKDRLILDGKHIGNIFYFPDYINNNTIEENKEKDIFIKKLEIDKVTLYNGETFSITQTFYKILVKFNSTNEKEINILTPDIAVNLEALKKTILRLQNKLNKKIKINKVRNKKLWYLSK